jgi:hypothetical protein
MRRIFLAAVAATAIMMGMPGASLATTADGRGVTVRQNVTPDVTIIESPFIQGSGTTNADLSNDRDDDGD